ncbi:tripartite tricarboxylate transporter TctB family protein [Pseudogracilibacillus auburnensis]|uniref:tripartite tricarboxylate transporter TctB family protein n=1 Tax=Pseudogracilibacillus auburnensis TaxID=1494959 RepID=UPI001A975803|nr:tripartite tricarboxylate transporter TctB family protein [Pseudogracilibacillus auburnensis]MBO1003261.1 tripartite tricarboxylate transporter TctB family protein [Pseudogracilibacillus auburnensis]
MQTAKKLAPGMIMVIVSLIFFSQALVMEKASIFDPAGGSFFPALISIIMLLTGISVILQQRPTHQSEENKEETFSLKEYKFILTFFAMIVVYVILLSIITFFPATFIFLSASMLYLKNVSWKVNILVSIGSVIVIYLLFSKLFHIIFP